MCRSRRADRVTTTPAGSRRSCRRQSGVRRLSTSSLRERLPEGYGPLLAEELGVADRRVSITRRPSADEFRVVVIGAGVSGLLAAIELERANIPFIVIEKDETVGGTWWENSYPGCGVDTPTHLYSLSFAQRPDWSRYFAK